MEGKCSRHDQTKLSLSPLTVAAGVPNAAVGRRGQAPKGAAALHLRHPGACPALVRSAGARGSGPAVVLTHLVFLHLHALFAAHPRRARRGNRHQGGLRYRSILRVHPAKRAGFGASRLGRTATARSWSAIGRNSRERVVLLGTGAYIPPSQKARRHLKQPFICASRG